MKALDSDTWEEAPFEVGNWFRQRVRWQKGWMRPVNDYFCTVNINRLAHFKRGGSPLSQRRRNKTDRHSASVRARKELRPDFRRTLLQKTVA